MSLRSRFSTRIGPLAALFATVATGLALLGTPQAQAHHNQGLVGTFWPKDAYCEANNQIVSYAPMMYASTTHARQWVSFITHLQELTSTGWRTVATTPRKWAFVFHYETGTYQWVDQYGRPTFAHDRFTVPRIGRSLNAPIFYRLVNEYYWHADQYRTWGWTSSVNPTRDNRVEDPSPYNHCRFPGANFLVP